MKADSSPALLPLYAQGWQQGLAHTGWSINISERIHYWIPKCVWRNKCSYSLSRSYISSEWSLLRIYLLSHQTNCKLLWGQKFWPSDSGALRTAALNLDCTGLKNPNGQAAPLHQSNRILGAGGGRFMHPSSWKAPQVILVASQASGHGLELCERIVPKWTGGEVSCQF